MSPPANRDYDAQPLQRVRTDTIAYLFENMEAEMEEVYALDPPLAQYQADIAKYEGVIAARKQVEEEHRIKAQDLGVRIADLEAQIKALRKEQTRHLGEAQGHLTYQQFLRRLIRVRQAKTNARRKVLVRREANKRLAGIGRQLRQARPGGAPEFVIVDKKT